MSSRTIFFLLAACGAREPARSDVAVARPSASSFDRPVETTHESLPPTDRMGTMTVSGRLPPEIIQRVLKPILPRALACNPRAQTDEATAVVRFVVDRQGEVASVKLDDSSNVSDPVSACVTAIFQSLHFPPPEGGIVTVVYPVVFHTR